jgi:RND superfamily putative drug exporter
MVRLAEFVLRHRRLVMAFWLVAFVAGGVAASPAGERLTADFSLPGQPSYETEKQILDTFGNGGNNPPTIVVVTVPTGSTRSPRCSTRCSRRCRRPGW